MKAFARTLPRAAAALCLSCLLGACVTSGQGDKMRNDISQLQAEMKDTRAQMDGRMSETITQAQNEIRKLEKVLEEARSFLSQNNADLGAQLKELRQELAKLQGAMDQTQLELKKVTQDYDLFKRDVAQRFEQGASLPTDKDGLYSASKDLYDQGQWEKARQGFEKFAANFPKDSRAARATFYAGQCHMEQQRWVEAQYTFTQVLNNFPGSDAEGDATFRAGDALLEQGECDKAKLVYEAALSEHKKSPFAADARRRVDAIKGKKEPKCK